MIKIIKDKGHYCTVYDFKKRHKYILRICVTHTKYNNGIKQYINLQ